MQQTFKNWPKRSVTGGKVCVTRRYYRENIVFDGNRGTDPTHNNVCVGLCDAQNKASSENTATINWQILENDHPATMCPSELRAPQFYQGLDLPIKGL